MIFEAGVFSFRRRFYRIFCYPVSQEEQDSEQSKEESIVGCTWVDTLSEDDLVKLRPLLFVELSAIFDKAANPFPKIKPFKRKRKQGG